MKTVKKIIWILLLGGVVVNGFIMLYFGIMGELFFALSLIPYTVLGFANKHSPAHWFGQSILLVATLIVTVGGVVIAAGIAGQLHKDALSAVGFVFLPMYQTAVAVLGVVIMWVGTQIAK